MMPCEATGGVRRSEVNETMVIHVNEMNQFPEAVYIGREIPSRSLPQSRLANPFKVKTWGRDLALSNYRSAMLSWVKTFPDVQEELIAIRGKPIACWCRRSTEEVIPGNACHGDFLVEFLASHSDDEIRGCS